MQRPDLSNLDLALKVRTNSIFLAKPQANEFQLKFYNKAGQILLRLFSLLAAAKWRPVAA